MESKGSVCFKQALSQKLDFQVTAAAIKKNSFAFPEIVLYAHIPPRCEGRIAIVTNVRRGAVAVRARSIPLNADERVRADGEVVWS
jgi:hypothetical protein